MELGSNFAAKLEPFLLIAKSLKGAAAAKLIQDATSAPGVFVFSELLELPNIQELANSDQHAKWYHLLQLFSYKTYQDYLQNKDALPPLNAAQTIKLKHLSIVSLATERRILPYALLLQSLEMPTVRELEDLIIDAIYLDILRGKLDQKEEQLEVEYTMGRDLEPGKIEALLAALKDWAATTSTVLTTLDEKLSSLSSNAAAAKVQQQEYETEMNTTLKDIYDKQRNKDPLQGMGMLQRRLGGGGGGGSSTLYGGNTWGAEREKERERENMDVDEPSDPSKGRNRKAPPQEAAAKSQRKRNRF